jgi:hypothetical protein
MAETRVVVLNVETGQAQQNVEALNEDLAQTNDRLEDVSEGSKKVEDNFDDITKAADKLTGGAISGFKGMITSIKGAVTGLKTMKGALIATGIGAFVVVVGSLISAFTSTEEGSNKLNKILGQIGVVFGNLKDLAAEFGNGLLSLGDAISKVFAGDFKGAIDSVGEAFSGFTEKAKNFNKETREELKIAARISDMLADAAKMERQLKVERAQADQDRARLLEQAVNKEKFSAEERIGFLQQASKIEEEITNKEIGLAQKKLDAQILQNSLSGSTQEDLEAEAELQANVIALETARLSKQREVTGQILGLYNEEMALRKTRDAEANAFALQIEKDAADRKKLQKDKELKDDEEAKAKADKDMKDGLARLQYEANQKVAIAQFVADAEAQIRQANLDNAAAGFALLGQLAGLLGESAIGVAKIIINTKAANAAATLKYALIPGGALLAKAEQTANNISAGIGIAANVAATAKGLSALKSGGSPQGASVGSVTGGRGVAEPQTPQFNIVGTSGSNQLAETISGQNRQPLKAYVVASDVSTAQSLQRNIISGASI